MNFAGVACFLRMAALHYTSETPIICEKRKQLLHNMLDLAIDDANHVIKITRGMQ